MSHGPVGNCSKLKMLFPVLANICFWSCFRLTQCRDKENKTRLSPGEFVFTPLHNNKHKGFYE